MIRFYSPQGYWVLQSYQCLKRNAISQQISQQNHQMDAGVQMQTYYIYPQAKI